MTTHDDKRRARLTRGRRARRPSLEELAAVTIAVLWLAAPSPARSGIASDPSQFSGPVIGTPSQELPAWCAAGPPVMVVGSAQGPAGQELDGVAGAHRLSDGSLVIANGGSRELRFFDSSGRFRHSVGGAGDGPGEFRQLALLRSFAGDSLLVFDGRQARVTVMGPEGELARSFRTPSADGFVIVEDAFDDGRTVARVVTGYRSDDTSTGVHRSDIRLLELSRTGEVVRDLGEFPGDESFALASSGSMIVGPLVFGATLHVAALSQDRIVVGASDEDRLRFIDRGTSTPVVHGLPRRRTGAGDFRRAMEAYLAGFPEDARAIEARRFDDMPRVEAMPAFAEIRADADGNAWVRHHLPPGDPTRSWTVFDEAGTRIATATTPDRTDILEIVRDRVVVLARDDLGVERVEVVSLDRGCPR